MDKDQFHDQTVYFHVLCHELKNKNVITKMDTFCTLSLEDGKEIDRTEIQKANQSPSYMKALSIVRSSYEESSVSAFAPITFTIFNSYFANYKSHEDFIGKVCVNIHTLATSPNGVINLTLVDKNNVDIGATVTIRFEDKIAQDFKFNLQFAGSDLAKKDLFGKSDPYFIISREINGRTIDIYKSEIIKKNLDPIWTTFRMTFKRFL